MNSILVLGLTVVVMIVIYDLRTTRRDENLYKNNENYRKGWNKMAAKNTISNIVIYGGILLIVLLFTGNI